VTRNRCHIPFSAWASVTTSASCLGGRCLGVLLKKMNRFSMGWAKGFLDDNGLIHDSSVLQEIPL